MGGGVVIDHVIETLARKAKTSGNSQFIQKLSSKTHSLNCSVWFLRLRRYDGARPRRRFGQIYGLLRPRVR